MEFRREEGQEIQIGNYQRRGTNLNPGECIRLARVCIAGKEEREVAQICRESCLCHLLAVESLADHLIFLSTGCLAIKWCSSLYIANFLWVLEMIFVKVLGHSRCLISAQMDSFRLWFDPISSCSYFHFGCREMCLVSFSTRNLELMVKPWY